jgi:hypothetical protein
MEMVLERAAKLAAQADENVSEELRMQDGMRLGARFMRDDDFDMRDELNQSKDEHVFLVQGALSVLLRNIHLPRDEEDHPVMEKAMRGILQLGESEQLLSLLGETKKITEQYNQHKTQIRGQLEEQFAQQIAMMQQQQGGGAAGLDPANHPKFAEEWQKVMTQLQDQYGEALETHKSLIKRIFAG